MPTVELAQVVEFLDNKRKPITEKDRVAGPYPYYGANGVQDYVADWIFDEDLILLAEDGGHFENPDRGVAYKIIGKTWVNNHAHVLRAKKVDVDYLKHVLKNMDLMPYVNGATRLKLTKSSAEKIKIPLPPLAEQKRIAAILDKAAEIKSKREQAIAKLNELAQSTFMEMFGDPISNEKKWQQEKLASLVKGKYGVKAGPFGSALKKEEYVERGYKIYGQEQVIAGSMTIGAYYISREKYKQLSSCSIEEGDVLVSLVGSFGKVLVVPQVFEEGIINPRLLKISPDKAKILPHFLSEFLKNEQVQEKLKSNAHGGTMGILNAGLLKDLELIVPPISLQEKFITLREKFKSRAKKMHESDKALRQLLNSLQHQAFTTGFTA